MSPCKKGFASPLCLLTCTVLAHIALHSRCRKCLLFRTRCSLHILVLSMMLCQRFPAVLLFHYWADCWAAFPIYSWTSLDIFCKLNAPLNILKHETTVCLHGSTCKEMVKKKTDSKLLLQKGLIQIIPVSLEDLHLPA